MRTANRITTRQMKRRQLLALRSRLRREQLIKTRCHKTKTVVALRPLKQKSAEEPAPVNRIDLPITNPTTL